MSGDEEASVVAALRGARGREANIRTVVQQRQYWTYAAGKMVRIAVDGKPADGKVVRVVKPHDKKVTDIEVVMRDERGIEFSVRFKFAKDKGVEAEGRGFKKQPPARYTVAASELNAAVRKDPDAVQYLGELAAERRKRAEAETKKMTEIEDARARRELEQQRVNVEAAKQLAWTDYMYELYEYNQGRSSHRPEPPPWALEELKSEAQVPDPLANVRRRDAKKRHEQLSAIGVADSSSDEEDTDAEEPPPAQNNNNNPEYPWPPRFYGINRDPNAPSLSIPPPPDMRDLCPPSKMSLIQRAQNVEIHDVFWFAFWYDKMYYQWGMFSREKIAQVVNYDLPRWKPAFDAWLAEQEKQ